MLSDLILWSWEVERHNYGIYSIILTLHGRKAGNHSYLQFHSAFSLAQGRPGGQNKNPQTTLKHLRTHYLIQNSINWNKPFFFIFANALPDYLLDFRISNFLKACWLYTLKGQRKTIQSEKELHYSSSLRTFFLHFTVHSTLGLTNTLKLLVLVQSWIENLGLQYF